MTMGSLAFGQLTFNANFGDINFGGTGVTITNKVGTGLNVGDVVLYENVITIGTQQIDAIVRTTDLSNVSTFLNFDNPSTSGSSMTNNQPRFFSPQFDFSGAGYAQFQFEFILGGSYNNTTDSGTIITLENTMINTYDIDGNGGSGTNQYNEFGGFDTSSLASNTRVVTSYNTSSGLTKFRSNSSSNVSNVLDDRTRVRVSYAKMNSFSIRVGADAGGYAYFFLDFSPGGGWQPDIFTNPTLDLDTTSGGNDLIDTFCNEPVYFTKGGTNIVSPGNTVDEIIVSFNNNMVLDGAAEKIVVQGMTSGDSIPLNFTNGQSISDITLLGVSYSITATVSGNTSTLRIERTSGTMSDTEAESFIDSMSYFNTSPTTGYRVFNMSVREESYTSPNASFELLVSCSVLPVNLLSFSAEIGNDNNVHVKWVTSSERHCSHYYLEKLVGPDKWQLVTMVPGNGTTHRQSHYSVLDMNLNPENCYRIVQFDHNGSRAYSHIICVEHEIKPGIVLIYPNPTDGMLNLACVLCTDDQLSVFNQDGMNVSSEIEITETETGFVLNMMSLPNGIYYLEIQTSKEVIVQRFTVMH